MNSPHIPSSNDVPAPKVTVVLPAHNEQEFLGTTVRTLTTFLDDRDEDYEILIVENGSNDKTLMLADTLSLASSRVRVITFPDSNYGEALFQGIVHARGKIVATFDVDLYDTAFFEAASVMLEEDDYDLVLASKRAPQSHDERPLLRRVLTRAFTFMLKMLVDLPVTDAHGMKMMLRDRLEPIVDRCALRGSLFDVELVVRAARVGCKIGELPVTVRELRPPRSGVAQRTWESFIGAVQLRRLLRQEARAGRGASVPA